MSAPPVLYDRASSTSLLALGGAMLAGVQSRLRLQEVGTQEEAGRTFSDAHSKRNSAFYVVLCVKSLFNFTRKKVCFVLFFVFLFLLEQ